MLFLWWEMGDQTCFSIGIYEFCLFLLFSFRELPAMDDLEFEKLDRLSGGKLRHLLLGSPSGYSWTEQVRSQRIYIISSF